MAQRAAGLGNRERAGRRETSARSALCRFRGAAQCRSRKMGRARGIWGLKTAAEGVFGTENGSQRVRDGRKRERNYDPDSPGRSEREKHEKWGENGPK